MGKCERSEESEKEERGPRTLAFADKHQPSRMS